MNDQQRKFTKLLGIETPLICGAMYPCSNPELVAAVSEAGAIGVVQPLSYVYVYRYEFRAGLQKTRSLTQKPIGMNVIVEKNSQLYEERMRTWVNIALEEGIRFFITALGNPAWVVKLVESSGGIVFHDVTERKWAMKALDCGVHGLICVNNRAGGHAGSKSAAELFAELHDFNVPLVCAGGIGTPQEYQAALKIGYAAAQLGTRFIASTECGAHDSYKQAIVSANETDIVLTERVTGVPLSVIRTPYVERIGTKVGPLTRLFLKNPRTRHWTRFLINLISVWKLKRSALKGLSSKDYWQAGKSVAGIERIEPAGEIVKRFAASLG